MSHESTVPSTTGQTLEIVARWFRFMEIDGLTLDDLQRAIDSQKLRNRLMHSWKSARGKSHDARAAIGDPIPDSDSHAKARAIMGKNFLGLEEVRKGYGITFTEEQLQQLAEIPFSEETLHAYKDTHVLVAGVPFSVNEIRTLADGDFYDTGRYRNESFANDKKVSVRWYLLRKEPVPESRSKTYNQQTALLKEEEVPFVCEMTYMVILYWLTHRERLLPGVYVRCQDKETDGNRVHVGLFDSGGFNVNYYWDALPSDRIGLASSVPSRKS